MTQRKAKRDAVVIGEAEGRGVTAWEFDPESKAITGYRSSIKENNTNSRKLFGGYLHLCEIVDHVLKASRSNNAT